MLLCTCFPFFTLLNSLSSTDYWLDRHNINAMTTASKVSPSVPSMWLHFRSTHDYPHFHVSQRFHDNRHMILLQSPNSTFLILLSPMLYMYSQLIQVSPHIMLLSECVCTSSNVFHYCVTSSNVFQCSPVTLSTVSNTYAKYNTTSYWV